MKQYRISMPSTSCPSSPYFSHALVKSIIIILSILRGFSGCSFSPVSMILFTSLHLKACLASPYHAGILRAGSYSLVHNAKCDCSHQANSGRTRTGHAFLGVVRCHKKGRNVAATAAAAAAAAHCNNK
jgi:hypothetical protein